MVLYHSAIPRSILFVVVVVCLFVCQATYLLPILPLPLSCMSTPLHTKHLIPTFLMNSSHSRSHLTHASHSSRTHFTHASHLTHASHSSRTHFTHASHSSLNPHTRQRKVLVVHQEVVVVQWGDQAEEVGVVVVVVVEVGVQ